MVIFIHLSENLNENVNKNMALSYKLVVVKDSEKHPEMFTRTEENVSIENVQHQKDTHKFATNGNLKVKKNAYGFVAATTDHLTAAMVNIQRLKRFGSKEVDYIIYTNLIPGLCNYSDVHLIPYEKVHLPSPNGYYVDCMVKLLFFNMTKYDRIIYMDVDALVLKSLDELFMLPSVILASPVAYWEDEPCFTSAMLVIQPNTKTWTELYKRINLAVVNGKFDMDLLNSFFQHKLGNHAKTFPEVLLLPGYFLVLSSHFRDRIHGKDEKRNLKSLEPFSDIDDLANRTYVVHFSNQPKPWSLSVDEVKAYPSISDYFYSLNLIFKAEYDKIRLRCHEVQHLKHT
jgi:hypothetical protein